VLSRYLGTIPYENRIAPAHRGTGSQDQRWRQAVAGVRSSKVLPCGEAGHCRRCAGVSVPLAQTIFRVCSPTSICIRIRWCVDSLLAATALHMTRQHAVFMFWQVPVSI
jgi:hypothetical protein